MRLDRLLYFLRFAKSRSLAHDLAASGHLRRNGVRVTRVCTPVEQGDVLTFMQGGRVRVVEILDLPRRRGPASEAQTCYRELDPHGRTAIAATTQLDLERDTQP
jgi:ribosome-associated heat shock protein Hsp15